MYIQSSVEQCIARIHPAGTFCPHFIQRFVAFSEHILCRQSDSLSFFSNGHHDQFQPGCQSTTAVRTYQVCAAAFHSCNLCRTCTTGLIHTGYRHITYYQVILGSATGCITTASCRCLQSAACVCAELCQLALQQILPDLILLKNQQSVSGNVWQAAQFVCTSPQPYCIHSTVRFNSICFYSSVIQLHCISHPSL